MAVDTTQFSQVAEFGQVSKLEEDVDTPMPETEDGSGYTTEENRKVVYSIGDYLVKVSKVSNRGWSVTRYEGENIDEMEMDYHSEDEAHTIARAMVEEVADSRTRSSQQ